MLAFSGVSLTNTVDLNAKGVMSKSKSGAANSVLTNPGQIYVRFRSDVNSGDFFYTDINSYAWRQRKRRYPSMPISANYYPITSSVYIQDYKERITLLTAQPHGIYSVSFALVWNKLVQFSRFSLFTCYRAITARNLLQQTRFSVKDKIISLVAKCWVHNKNKLALYTYWGKPCVQMSGKHQSHTLLWVNSM